MAASFEPDANVEKIAEAYGLDAVDIANRNFRINLDWSERGVELVENILGQLHDSLAESQALLE